MYVTEIETGLLAIPFPGARYQYDSQSTRQTHNVDSLMFAFPSPFENVQPAVNLEAHGSLHHVMGRNVLFVVPRDMW